MKAFRTFVYVSLDPESGYESIRMLWRPTVVIVFDDANNHFVELRRKNGDLIPNLSQTCKEVAVIPVVSTPVREEADVWVDGVQLRNCPTVVLGGV